MHNSDFSYSSIHETRFVLPVYVSPNKGQHPFSIQWNRSYLVSQRKVNLLPIQRQVTFLGFVWPLFLTLGRRSLSTDSSLAWAGNCSREGCIPQGDRGQTTQASLGSSSASSIDLWLENLYRAKPNTLLVFKCQGHSFVCFQTHCLGNSIHPLICQIRLICQI